MKKHFAEAAKILVNKIGINPNYKYIRQTALNSFVFIDIDNKYEVRREIHKFKINKVPDNLKSET